MQRAIQLVLTVTVCRRKAWAFCLGRVLDFLIQGVTMLAEIFMLRLEATARALRETVPSSTSQFISLAANSQVAFKENRNRPSDAVHEQPTSATD